MPDQTTPVNPTNPVNPAPEVDNWQTTLTNPLTDAPAENVSQIFWGWDEFNTQDMEPIQSDKTFTSDEPKIIDNVSEFAEPIDEVRDSETSSEWLTDNLEVTLETGQNSFSNSLIWTFQLMYDKVEEIFELGKVEEFFPILWGKSTSEIINYNVYLIKDDAEQEIYIKKIITNLQDKSEDEHLLQFTYRLSDKTLEILVDEENLYQFEESTENKERDTILIREKMDKFNFLFTAYLDELKKAENDKKQAEVKKHQLQDIFRNF